MKQMTFLLQNKRIVAGLILLSALVYVTFGIQENSQKIRKIATLESGIQTCFSRVNQTYTAKLIGEQASNYLTANFQSLTEECFAEGILNIEESFKAELAGTLKNLSTLASNIHWFHEDVLAPDATNIAGVEGRNVGARFEKIETTKDEILDSTEQFKTQLSNILNKQKIAFYVMAALLVMVMVMEYLDATRRKLLNYARENEARAELLENGGVESVKVGEIVRQALEQNDLINCSKLFNNYYVHHSFEKAVKAKNKISTDNLVTPSFNTASSQTAIDEKIEKIWNDDTIGLTADNQDVSLSDLNLDLFISRTTDLLSDKLFSAGIQLDSNVNESITVKGDAEELDQIMYHMFCFGINAAATAKNNRNLSITANKLGDIVALDFSFSGTGFSAELLKERLGMQKGSATLEVDLQVCQGLLEEIDGKMVLDNKINQNGEVTGGRIKMILKSGKTLPQGKLVDLKIGTKKEVMAAMEQSLRNSI